MDSFSNFSHLPMELQNAIWLYTFYGSFPTASDPTDLATPLYIYTKIPCLTIRLSEHFETLSATNSGLSIRTSRRLPPMFHATHHSRHEAIHTAKQHPQHFTDWGGAWVCYYSKEDDFKLYIRNSTHPIEKLCTPPSSQIWAYGRESNTLPLPSTPFDVQLRQRILNLGRPARTEADSEPITCTKCSVRRAMQEALEKRSTHYFSIIMAPRIECAQWCVDQVTRRMVGVWVDGARHLGDLLGYLVAGGEGMDCGCRGFGDGDERGL